MKAVKSKKISIILLLCVNLVTNLTHAGSNPASTAYVDKKIAEQSLVAGQGISIQNKTISVNPVLNIGDLYQGGIVVWLDDTKQHGLAVSLREDGFDAFGSNADQYRAIYGNGIGAGKINSAALLAVAPVNDRDNIAVISVSRGTSVQSDGITTCDVSGLDSIPAPSDIPTTCYGDFYLPSVYELQVMFANINTINTAINNAGGTSIPSAFHWTSTYNYQTNDGQVFVVNPVTGLASSVDGTDNSVTYQSRGVRQF